MSVSSLPIPQIDAAARNQAGFTLLSLRSDDAQRALGYWAKKIAAYGEEGVAGAFLSGVTADSAKLLLKAADYSYQICLYDPAGDENPSLIHLYESPPDITPRFGRMVLFVPYGSQEQLIDRYGGFQQVARRKIDQYAQNTKARSWFQERAFQVYKFLSNLTSADLLHPFEYIARQTRMIEEGRFLEHMTAWNNTASFSGEGPSSGNDQGRFTLSARVAPSATEEETPFEMKIALTTEGNHSPERRDRLHTVRFYIVEEPDGSRTGFVMAVQDDYARLKMETGETRRPEIRDMLWKHFRSEGSPGSRLSFFTIAAIMQKLGVTDIYVTGDMPGNYHRDPKTDKRILEEKRAMIDYATSKIAGLDLASTALDYTGDMAQLWTDPLAGYFHLKAGPKFTVYGNTVEDHALREILKGIQDLGLVLH